MNRKQFPLPLPEVKKENVIEIDLTDENTHESVFAWCDKARKTFLHLSKTTEQSFINYLKDYLKSLDKNASNFSEAANTVKAKMLNHINVFHSTFKEMNFSPDCGYYELMEDIVAFYCNMEVEVLCSQNSSGAPIGKFVKPAVERTARIVTIYLSSQEKHIMHVLIKINLKSYDLPVCKRFLSDLFGLMIMKCPPKDCSDEGFCRGYIFFQKWKRVCREHEKPSLDQIMHKIYKRGADTVQSNDFIRQIIPRRGPIDKMFELIGSPLDISKEYFEHIAKKKEDTGVSTNSFSLFDTSLDSSSDEDEEFNATYQEVCSRFAMFPSKTTEVKEESDEEDEVMFVNETRTQARSDIISELNDSDDDIVDISYLGIAKETIKKPVKSFLSSIDLTETVRKPKPNRTVTAPVPTVFEILDDDENNGAPSSVMYTPPLEPSNDDHSVKYQEQCSFSTSDHEESTSRTTCSETDQQENRDMADSLVIGQVWSVEEPVEKGPEESENPREELKIPSPRGAAESEAPEDRFEPNTIEENTECFPENEPENIETENETEMLDSVQFEIEEGLDPAENDMPELEEGEEGSPSSIEDDIFIEYPDLEQDKESDEMPVLVKEEPITINNNVQSIDKRVKVNGISKIAEGAVEQLKEVQAEAVEAEVDLRGAKNDFNQFEAVYHKSAIKEPDLNIYLNGPVNKKLNGSSKVLDEDELGLFNNTQVSKTLLKEAKLGPELPRANGSRSPTDDIPSPAYEAVSNWRVIWNSNKTNSILKVKDGESKAKKEKLRVTIVDPPYRGNGHRSPQLVQPRIAKKENIYIDSESLKAYNIKLPDERLNMKPTVRLRMTTPMEIENWLRIQEQKRVAKRQKQKEQLMVRIDFDKSTKEVGKTDRVEFIEPKVTSGVLPNAYHQEFKDSKEKGVEVRRARAKPQPKKRKSSAAESSATRRGKAPSVPSERKPSVSRSKRRKKENHYENLLDRGAEFRNLPFRIEDF